MELLPLDDLHCYLYNWVATENILTGITMMTLSDDTTRRLQGLSREYITTEAVTTVWFSQSQIGDTMIVCEMYLYPILCSDGKTILDASLSGVHPKLYLPFQTASKPGGPPIH